MGVSDSGGRARVLGVTAAFSSGTCTGCGTDKAAPFLASPPHLQAGSYLPLLKTHHPSPCVITELAGTHLCFRTL